MAGTELPLLTSHPRAELPFFTALISLNNCKRIIEIGVGNGESTRYLCEGAMLTGGHVWGFDAWQRHGLRRQFGQFSRLGRVYRGLVGSGIPPWVFDLRRIDTRQNRDKLRTILEQQCSPIDFCFIDGCHSYIGVQNDFFLVYDLLSVGGIIAFHDTFCIDGCREFILDLRSKYYDGTYDIVDFPHGLGDRHTGISLLVKRSYHKQNRPMDEVCNLEDRREEIEIREREWYIAQEQLHANAKALHKPDI